VDERDRRAHITELGADHEPEPGAGAEPGVRERDPRRRDGKLADARESPGLRLVDEPVERGAADGDHRSAARRQERPDVLPAAGDRARDDTDARDDDTRHRYARPKSSVTFCPPKPKEFEIAYSTAASRATRGTQSNATSGSGVSRPAVGGTTSWTSVRTVAAAAIVWPIMDLVELIRSRSAPNTSRMARASIRLFCGVAVPCALA